MRRRSRGDDGRGDPVESPEPRAGSYAPKVAGQIETPRPPDPILRRPRADREEKRVTHGRDTSGRPPAMRYVTEINPMPRGRRPEGDHALSNAERQASYRARLAPPPLSTPHPRSCADRRSRPQRWRDAVAVLLALQVEYAAWLEALPENLHDSPTAQALEAIVTLDLDTLADTDPPRGYGRD
jgi:hypothetical protein